MFRHSVSERQHIQRPMNIWLLQEGAGLTVKLLTHWLITNKWHEWDLKCRFSYVWPKMSDDLSSDMFTEVRKTLSDWQVQTFFTVSVLLLFLMFESFSFLFPFFFPRLVSDHFLVISVCLFVALAHVSVCWVCFLSVWFTLGGLCNFFGQCILCLTCFFFAHFGKSANTLPRSLHESGSFRNTWSCIFSAYCLTPWSFLQLTVNAE